MIRLPSLLLACSLGVGTLAGCGRGITTGPGDVQAQDLADFWMIHRAYTEQQGRPPQKLDDIEPLRRIAAGGVMEKMKAGGYIVNWDSAGAPNAAGTVLAYAKEVPSEGGYALMADGSVKRLTAQEFRAPPKAGTH